MKNGVFAIWLILLNFIFGYLAMPVFAWGFSSALVLLMINGIGIGLYATKIGAARISFLGYGTLLASFIFLITVNIGSSWMVSTDGHKNLIGSVEESNFRTDVETIDLSQLRVVDQALAVKRAEELMGQDAGLGSKVKIGTMSIQSVNGKLVWVAALEPSGLFKWVKMEGTPGYVVVSATNYRDAEMHLNKNLHYTKDSYFSYGVQRHLWLSGYASTGITDYTLELDDNNEPWWVVTLYDKAVGWKGNDAYGVVVVNPTTGELKEYDIASAPSWIDRIQPETFIANQLDAWGQLKNGWWNQIFLGAKDGITKTTTGTSLVYTKDGSSRWYTGMTSVGNDAGTVGFVLVDTRTKEARMYRVTGPTEDAAQKVLNGAVSNFGGYTATFPIMVNIGGKPTYAATIKDGDGNIKQYGFVSGTNRAVFGIGKNVRQAMRAYQSAHRNSGMSSGVSGAVDIKTVKGTVTRIGTEVVSGNQTYFVMIDSAVDRVFRAAAGDNVELAITTTGDVVAIEYADGGMSVVDVKSFDNTAIDLRTGEIEGIVETDNEQVRDAEDNKLLDAAVEDKLKALTPEEKRKLLAK